MFYFEINKQRGFDECFNCWSKEAEFYITMCSNDPYVICNRCFDYLQAQVQVFKNTGIDTFNTGETKVDKAISINTRVKTELENKKIEEIIFNANKLEKDQINNYVYNEIKLLDPNAKFYNVIN
jgi:hypothetical protein